MRPYTEKLLKEGSKLQERGMLDQPRASNLYKKQCAAILKAKQDDIAKCENSLSYFLKQSWPSMERQEYVPGWHSDAICEHLMAVSSGEINRLLINVPPRTGKTNAVSIAWPAWTWAQQDISDLTGPQVAFLCASYGNTLALEISTKCRRLIESDWYQKYWGNRFKIREDQNTKSRFDTTKGGSRIATSVGGSLTGLGASIILVDDVHNAQEMDSQLVIRSAVQWFSEGLQSRLNNPKTGAIVVIMQRLSDEDLSGYVLAKESGYVHLNLPLEYDSSRHCTTSLGWTDPRSEDGELLCPERIGPFEAEKLKKDLGSYAFSAQYQQAPTPRGGGIIKDKWWKLYPEYQEVMDEYGKPVVPLEYPAMEFIIASLDPAYTAKEENDYSALTVWGVWRKDGAPKVMLMSAWKERLELNDLINKVRSSCTKAKGLPVDRLLIENKASGKSVAQEIIRLFDGAEFGVELVEPKGDKVSRMYAVQHLFENGVVYAPDRSWAQMVIDEVSKFPKGAHDDLCFIAGTMVATKRGDVPIEDVTLLDEVLTPDGWRRVQESKCTGIRRVMTRFGLTGTPDHPIFTLDKSYQEMRHCSDKLVRNDVCGWIKIALLKTLSSTELNTHGWEEKVAIIYRKQQDMRKGKVLKVCMSQFGNFITTLQFRKAMTLTIRTVIHLIASLIIWSVYRKVSIAVCLRRILTGRRIGSNWHRLTTWRRRGISRKKEGRGTGSTLKPAFAGHVPCMSGFAKCVQESILQSILPRHGFARTVVQLNGMTERTRELFYLKWLTALFAGLNTSPRYLKEQNIVAPNVGTKTHNENAHFAPVYNLKVEFPSCFFANGILVHNCDALSQALSWLRNSNFALRTDEYDAGELESRMLTKPVQALYDV